MEFGFAYIGLLIYVATLAGMIGYHVGFTRGKNAALNIKIDENLIVKLLRQNGWVVMPSGVEWPGSKRNEQG